MATSRFETAAQIVKDAAPHLGLPVVADPLASTEAAQVRLCACLTAAGREVVGLYQWPHLRKVCEITAAAGDGRAWTLPADCAGVIPNTAWNQTTNTRIVGPIDAEEWAKYEAEGSVFSSLLSFRIVQGVFAVVPTANVTDGDVLQYEYQSKSWVSATGGTTPTEDRATTGTDIVYLDPLLMHWALRRSWKISNSEATAVEEANYWAAVERFKSAETYAETLSIIPRRRNPLVPNVRDGSWTL